MSPNLTRVEIIEATITKIKKKKKKGTIRRKGRSKAGCEVRVVVCKVQKLKGGKKSRAEAQRSAMNGKPEEMKPEEGFGGGK